MDEAITELITSYNELNSSSIIELDHEPSPLEFMRFVAKNTPFVVRGGAADWKAVRTWSVDYLKETLANEQVNVAVTPFGYVPPLSRASQQTHPPFSPQQRRRPHPPPLRPLHPHLRQTPRRTPTLPRLPRLPHPPRTPPRDQPLGSSIRPDPYAPLIFPPHPH